MLIDLDRFKEVNDTMGHEQGDRLLVEVSARLGQLLRGERLLARLGGDEFAVLAVVPHRGAVGEVATRLHRALALPFDLGGVAIELGASIGIALQPDHGEDVSTLLRHADVAMYEAKRGGSRIETYSSARDPYSPERLKLLGDLRRALDHDELVLHFQPKVALSTGRVIGVEALVRWQHPERGLLGPDEFLALAERTGLIADITRWVLDAAVRQCAAWRRAGIELPVAVNLAAANIVDTPLPEAVAAVLQRWEVPGRLLECEISEDTVMGDPRRATDVLERLRGLGVRLSLDDFGTGHSSLSYLKRLPLDEVKIDRSFVIGMADDPSDAAIVRSTIDLARHLGLEVVAEGVETTEVLDVLAALECDVAQGFLLSRPLPAAEFDGWLGRPRLIALTSGKSHGSGSLPRRLRRADVRRRARPRLDARRAGGAERLASCTRRFFVIAPRAAAHPQLVAAIRAAGHAVELHCYEHVRHTEVDRAAIEDDTRRALATLAALGVRPRRWRTPWGAHAPWTAGDRRRPRARAVRLGRRHPRLARRRRRADAGGRRARPAPGRRRAPARRAGPRARGAAAARRPCASRG